MDDNTNVCSTAYSMCDEAAVNTPEDDAALGCRTAGHIDGLDYDEADAPDGFDPVYRNSVSHHSDESCVSADLDASLATGDSA